MEKLMTKINTVFRASFTGKFALLTNTVSGAVLFVVGDFIEQRVEQRRGVLEGVDRNRICRIGLIGLFEAPPHYIFYKYLDKILPGRSLTTVAKKILLDQLIACPMFSVQFFVGMGVLEGKGLKLAWQEFLVKFPTVYLVDWMLWPPCQLLNFLLIPPRYRVLYVNTVTVGWNVFLSYMKHNDPPGS